MNVAEREPKSSGECLNGMKTIVLHSYNRGENWPEYVDVMDNYVNHIAYWEEKISWHL